MALRALTAYIKAVPEFIFLQLGAHEILKDTFSVVNERISRRWGTFYKPSHTLRLAPNERGLEVSKEVQ